jgi:hypothetical protein
VSNTIDKYFNNLELLDTGIGNMNYINKLGKSIADRMVGININKTPRKE